MAPKALQVVMWPFCTNQIPRVQNATGGPKMSLDSVNNESNELKTTSPEIEMLPQNSYRLREIVPSVERKPRFVSLLVDFLCMVAVGIAILLFKFVIPPFKRGFYCDDTTINKPYKDSTVPSSVLYSVGFVLTLIVVSSTESYNRRTKERSRVKGKQDYHFSLGSFTLNATNTEILRLFMGFSYGGLISIFLTDIGKYTVGRLRPHFLSICKPPPVLISNCSHNYILADVCTGNPDLLREGRLSFPSGHASFSGTLKNVLVNICKMLQFVHCW